MSSLQTSFSCSFCHLPSVMSVRWLEFCFERLFQPSHAWPPSVLEGRCPRCDGEGPRPGGRSCQWTNPYPWPDLKFLWSTYVQANHNWKKNCGIFSLFLFFQPKMEKQQIHFSNNMKRKYILKVVLILVIPFETFIQNWKIKTDLYIISNRCDLEEEF